MISLSVHAQFGDEGGGGDDGGGGGVVVPDPGGGDPSDPGSGGTVGTDPSDPGSGGTVGTNPGDPTDPGNTDPTDPNTGDFGTHNPPNVQNPSDQQTYTVQNDDGTVSTWVWDPISGWHEASYTVGPGSTEPPPGSGTGTGTSTPPSALPALSSNGDGSYTLTFSDGSTITTNTDGTYNVSSGLGVCNGCTAQEAEVYVDPGSQPPNTPLPPNPTPAQLAAYQAIMSMWGAGQGLHATTSITFSKDAEGNPNQTNTDPDIAAFDDPTTSYPQQALPSWANVLANYPKDPNNSNWDMPAPQVYALVGGQIQSMYNGDPEAFQNACALRVSRALNYSGVTIPNIPGKTYQGGDGKYYFLSAAKLFNFMNKTFPGSLHLTQAQGGPNGANFPGLLGTKPGIYIMQSADPAAFGATGHCTLYNGSTFMGNVDHPNGAGYLDAEGGVSQIRLWTLN